MPIVTPSGATGGGGGLAFTGWTEDSADPANVSTNGGGLDLGIGNLQQESDLYATILQPGGITLTAIGDDNHGIGLSLSGGVFIYPPDATAINVAADPGNPCIAADGEYGATVALDAGGLTIQNLPTADPGTSGALWDNAGIPSFSKAGTAHANAYLFTAAQGIIPATGSGVLDGTALTGKVGASATSLPSVVAAASAVAQTNDAQIAYIPASSDFFDVTATLACANTLGTQFATAIVTATLSPGTASWVPDWTTATFTQVAGVDLTYDGASATISSTAGGVFVASLSISGSWD